MSSKDFIIKHMNADHADSLQLYLQAYNGITAHEAQGATMQDLTLSNLIITARGTRYSVPIQPPMKDYSEARARLIALNNDSLHRLGRWDVTLTEYRAPRGYQAVIFGLVVFTYVTCWRRSNLLPGAFVYENMGFKFVPDFAHFIYTIWPVFFPVVVGIHVLESVALAVLRLKPLGVAVGSKVWAMWMGSCFIEGFGSFVRIGQIVKEERAKKSGKKH
ncbi:hypothetical protein POX_e06896 [Penicillium oxalicum]|uniref:DUF2470 domain-containing protein n=1 Tax=Penicillium oxalicum (strain 114-2 / CGMCC 5302) TaxID=933388 RepID=S7ZGZ5_PENO1|nr:hypothetical protein POX_e06896 [Penicillium oxalicum]EPS27921.1 hypothetical protein PDE_02865 [Penicillium oxalicum 114-2]KAI2788872.1 hypothetical protein POX_e06896 [Penicillium oxalicum]